MEKDIEISKKLLKAREFEEKALRSTESVPKACFHVCSPVGWINDPNGFSNYKGEYHLFFQYHPYSTLWGPIHWGHVKTKDFIKWEQLPCALAPDEDYDGQGCFSGSAIEWNDKHIIVYTGMVDKKDENGHLIRQTQCIAIGDGINYEKLPQNPVINADSLPEGSSKEDFRDPKVWINEDYIYLVVGSRSKDGSGQIPMYRTKDLLNWEFITIIDSCNNEIGKMWECPDFFKLDDKQVLICSPQEVVADKEFHCGNCTVGLIGNYDENNNKFDRKFVQSIDYGLDFYAPQTVETEDGRRVMIGWMQSWDNHFYPSKFEWSGMMSIPRELRVENDRIYQVPVREIANYYEQSIEYYKQKISKTTSLKGIEGRHNDLTVELLEGEYSTFYVRVAVGNGKSTCISYDKVNHEVIIDRQYSGISKDIISSRKVKLLEKNKHVKMRIIMDKYSVEVFINDGEIAMSMLIFTEMDAEDIEFETDGNVIINVINHKIRVDN